MPAPTLNAASPVTVPSKTYDKVWIEELVIRGYDPNGDVTADARLRYFGEFDNGDGTTTREFGPDVVRLNATNLLSNPDADPDLDAAVTSLMAYVAKLAVAQGVVAAPQE